MLLVVDKKRFDQVALLVAVEGDVAAAVQAAVVKAAEQMGNRLFLVICLEERAFLDIEMHIACIFALVIYPETQVAGEVQNKVNEEVYELAVGLVDLDDGIVEQAVHLDIGLFFLDGIGEYLDDRQAQRELDRIGLRALQQVGAFAFGDGLQAALLAVHEDHVYDRERLKVAQPIAGTARTKSLQHEALHTIFPGVNCRDQVAVLMLEGAEHDAFCFFDHKREDFNSASFSSNPSNTFSPESIPSNSVITSRSPLAR